MPLPIEYVPADQKFLCYVISPKIKPDGKYTWKFQPRHCDNGITQIGGSDLNEPFVPIISDCPVSYSTALADSWYLIGGVLDNTNSS